VPRPVLRPLVLTIGLALAVPPALADPPPACPIGTLRCPHKSDDFSLCKPNALLDFYVSGLPTEGDREATPFDFEADRFQSADRSRYVLEGNARAQRLDQLLRADRLTYENATTAYDATGHVRYQDRGLLVSADHAQGTTDPATSRLDSVRYQLLDSRGNGTAHSTTMRDPDHYTLEAATYTTCDIDRRQWQIDAERIELDRESGVGRAWDMRLRYRDVPFLWLPYARFPIDDRRQSGFLYPQFMGSNSSGFNLTLPYYLNLAPNYDATLYPRIAGRRGFLFGGEFRYLEPAHHGQIEFTYLPNDREADRDRGYFHVENTSQLAPNWSFNANVSHVSDDRYFEDFGNSLTAVATSLLPSSVYLNGAGDGWSASIGGDRYQITDPNLPDTLEPYRRLPRLAASAQHNLLGGLTGGLKGELVAFRKQDALEGDRFDVYPWLAYPLEGAAWFLRPELGWRYTAYHIDRDTDSTPVRSLPIASLDAGLVFERDGVHLFGRDFVQTLEPRLYYLRVPYRNQDDLPVFDTQPISFDFPELFTTNRFAGADRQMDANNLTLALTSRLLESDSGVERVSASIGQIRYFDPQRVQMPGVPQTDYAGSDYVGELDVRLNDQWRLRMADQWNPNTDRTDLATVGLQRRFGTDGVFNLSYRYRRDFLEQFDVSTLVPLDERWRLVGRWNYSLRDSKTLESFAGIERDSCCVTWRVLARHYLRNAEGKADNALYFEIEFKGLGTLGQGTDDYLRRAILGYR